MTRNQVFALGDDELKQQFAKLTEEEYERTLEYSHFVAAMHDRGFDVESVVGKGGRLQRYLAVSEGRIIPALLRKLGFASHWLAIFMNYGREVQKHIQTGGTFKVLRTENGRETKIDWTFDQMSDSYREQVFGKDGPRDIETQLSWCDEQAKLRDYK